MTDKELLEKVKKLVEGQKENACCPNCGRCPTCGRLDLAPLPYIPCSPWPYTPWYLYQPYWYGTVGSSGSPYTGTISGGMANGTITTGGSNGSGAAGWMDV